MSEKNFVVAKADLKAKNKVFAEAGDVGIVEFESGAGLLVLFIRTGKKIQVTTGKVKRIDTSKLGDGFAKKICNVCSRLLPTKSFDKNQTGKDNRVVRRPSCKDCREIIDGKGVKTSVKRQWNKNKPKNEIFKCPVCKKTSIAGITKIVLDHDHNSGKVRGWICDSCNTGLGRFKDDTELLKNAIQYLKKDY